jgi:hypothetical protein
MNDPLRHPGFGKGPEAQPAEIPGPLVKTRSPLSKGPFMIVLCRAIGACNENIVDQFHGSLSTLFMNLL